VVIETHFVLEFKVKKKKKKKRLLGRRKNKTGPAPPELEMNGTSAVAMRPLPAIFDPTYHTQVTVFISPDSIKNESPTNELLLNVSSLASQS